MSVWTDGAARPDRASRRMPSSAWSRRWYFEATNVPILLGRGFEKEDNTLPRRVSVAVVTDTFARKLWGTTDVLGRTFRFEENGDDLSIVGCDSGCLRQRRHPASSAGVLRPVFRRAVA
jgi:hypothetical protein